MFHPLNTMAQVTYPYIFAKVRIQARSADPEVESGGTLLPPVGHHHDNPKHAGAITILSRVLQKEGVSGWYQVSTIISNTA